MRCLLGNPSGKTRSHLSRSRMVAVVGRGLLHVLLASSPSTMNMRAPSAKMGWSDPQWRWGSAIGAAHDEAMRVRGALSTPAARTQSPVLSGQPISASGTAPSITLRWSLTTRVAVSAVRASCSSCQRTTGRCLETICKWPRMRVFISHCSIR